MTLSEFLLARIAEDEAIARTATADVLGGDDLRVSEVESLDDAYVIEISQRRVLARCQSDRQLLELHADNGSIPGRYELRCFACDSDYPCDTLKIMALPYAGHPDYHPGWK